MSKLLAPMTRRLLEPTSAVHTTYGTQSSVWFGGIIVPIILAVRVHTSSYDSNATLESWTNVKSESVRAHPSPRHPTQGLRNSPVSVNLIQHLHKNISTAIGAIASYFPTAMSVSIGLFTADDVWRMLDYERIDISVDRVITPLLLAHRTL